MWLTKLCGEVHFFKHSASGSHSSYVTLSNFLHVFRSETRDGLPILMAVQSLKFFLVVIAVLTLASRARQGEFCVLVYTTTLLVGEIVWGVGLSTLQVSVSHSKQ